MEPRQPAPVGPTVVITGGPYSGKTTLVNALAARGYATVPEAAIGVIAELQREHGLEGQAAWRSAHPDRFQVLIAERQAELEERAAGARGPLFLDRGRHDGLAYCRLAGIPAPPEVTAIVSGHGYDHVVLLDTLRAFDKRAATGRTSDRAHSLLIRDALQAVYTEHGLAPVLVPELPVEDRVVRVLDLLDLP